MDPFQATHSGRDGIYGKQNIIKEKKENVVLSQLLDRPVGVWSLPNQLCLPKGNLIFPPGLSVSCYSWVDFFGTMFRYSGFLSPSPGILTAANRKTVLHRVDPSEHFLPIFRGENYPPALQIVTHYTPGPVLDRLRLRFV